MLLETRIEPAREPAATPHATEPATAAPQSVPPAAIDITIEPSFPQVGPESDSANIVVPMVGAKAETMAAPTTTAMDVLTSEPLTSMSPVTATSTTGAPRSRWWLILAAGVAVVGVVWGIAGAHRASRSPIRKGQTEPAVVLEAPKPSEPAQQAVPQPDPVVAQPPPTGTANGEPDAPELPGARSSDEKSSSNRASLNDKQVNALRGTVTGSAVARLAEPAANPPPPSPQSATGQASPSLNSPVTPQSGIVDPRAFPSSQGATASKVRVEIEPFDTKIAVNGKTATPPYVFDVPKGTRVVLEVARAGYITRRIVLDGSRELVKIGMIPEPKTITDSDTPKAEAAPKPVKAPKADPPKVDPPKVDPGPSAAPEDL